MPVYEPPRGKASIWVYIVGGCLALGLLAAIGFAVLGYFLTRTIHQAMTAPPPPRVPLSAYKFGYSGAAQCSIVLPDKVGTLTYIHVLPRTSKYDYGVGERAIRLQSSKGIAERPLMYYSSSRVRVGVYWYDASKSGGPHIRLLDDCGETTVDLSRRVTRAVLREAGRVYSGDLIDVHNYEGFGTEETYTNGKPTVTSVTFDGKPADDVTARFGKDQGTYLGTIVRKGNTLVFQAAKPSGP